MRALPRREFLSISVASSVLVLADTLRTRPTARAVADSLDWLSPARPDIVATYRAAPTEIDLAGTVVSTWAYNDMVPGPLLRATAGDVVEVKVDNAFDEATSIHWHGLAIVNSMDGVPGLTQADIDPALSSRTASLSPIPERTGSIPTTVCNLTTACTHR